MKKPLTVVRINEPYDVKLLEELAVEAVKPWYEFLEFAGVHPDVDEVIFDPPADSGGIALWVMDIVQRKVEYEHPDTYVLVVMPHPITTYERGRFSPGWGKHHVAFVSTHPAYMNPENKKDFIKYAKKVGAHEIAHLDPFELEHHEFRVYVPKSGNCPMYVEGNVDRVSLNKMGMKFCNNCYGIARRNQERDEMFEGPRMSGKHRI